MIFQRDLHVEAATAYKHPRRTQTSQPRYPHNNDIASDSAIPQLDFLGDSALNFAHHDVFSAAPFSPTDRHPVATASRATATAGQASLDISAPAPAHTRSTPALPRMGGMVASGGRR